MSGVHTKPETLGTLGRCGEGAPTPPPFAALANALAYNSV